MAWYCSSTIVFTPSPSLPDDTQIINLTPGLATQCGFSFKFDPMGNAMFFASLQNCFSQNMVTLRTVVFACTWNGQFAFQCHCICNSYCSNVILFTFDMESCWDQEALLQMSPVYTKIQVTRWKNKIIGNPFFSKKVLNKPEVLIHTI